jgi:hypothetical protein
MCQQQSEIGTLVFSSQRTQSYAEENEPIQTDSFLGKPLFFSLRISAFFLCVFALKNGIAIKHQNVKHFICPYNSFLN